MVVIPALAIVALGYGVLAFSAFPNLLPARATDAPDVVPAARVRPLAEMRTVEAILETVQVAINRNEHTQARTILESAVKQFPNDQALRLALADLYMVLAKPQGAELTLGLLSPEQWDLLSKSAAEYRAALEIGPRTAETEFTAGYLARHLDDLDAAEAHFAAAIALDRTIAMYPLHLAQVHFARRQFDEALGSLAATIALDPDQAVAWGMMAEISLTQGNPRLALQHIERALSLDATETAWSVIKARAHNRVMEPAEALRALAALPSAARLRPIIVRLAGESYGLLRDPKGALALYEQALSAADEFDPVLAFEAAQWAERAGSRDRAIELAQQGSMAGHEPSERLLARLQTQPPDQSSNKP